MGYHIGDCPNCGARLLVEYKDANKYYELDLTSSTIELTYIAQCWKCGSIVKATICSNIDEQPMEIKLVSVKEIEEGISSIKTRNLMERLKGMKVDL